MSTIKPEQLTSEVMKILEDFRGATEETVSYAVIETADKAVSELHEANPSGSGKYGSWTQYNMSWARTSLGGNAKKISSIIHNKKHYQLSHLLEFGHALRNGGRTKAFPHIAPVAEKAEDDLFNNIKKRISQG